MADERDEWGIAAFTGREPARGRGLPAQDGLYSLVVRSADRDDVTRGQHLARRSTAPASTAFDRAPSPRRATAVVTLTITEAGYALDADGRPDLDEPGGRRPTSSGCAATSTPRASTSPTRRAPPSRASLAGVEARRRAGARDPRDRLVRQPARQRRADARGSLELAELARRAAIARHLPSTSFVSTSIDRITPKTTAADSRRVAAATGWSDRAPVVTEPFHDWVLSGEFPSGRPAWERAGARFVDDIDPFERRKLWLLNGAHTLLAYAGAARGHRTVAEAIADPDAAIVGREFWSEAVRHLPAEGLDLDDVPRRPARALRQRAHPAPARSDRRGRHHEAPRAHRPGAARRARRGP